MKVFKSLVTLLLMLAMVCDCGVNALASGVASPVTPPTHTHTGGTATCKERAICDLCHRPYGELLPHTPEDIPGEAATCTESGLTVGIKCSVCDTILQEQQAIPATGHAFTAWTTVIRATANKPGLKQRECGNCGIVETQEIPATGNPADGYRIGNGIYLINGEDKSVTLTAWDDAADKEGMADKNGAVDKDGTVTIPNAVTIDGVEYEVTEIGGGAFANNESIAKVIVGEFVGKIGEGAFKNCLNLTVLNAKNCSYLSEIAASAFEGCKNLKEILLNTNSLEAIDQDAFKGIDENAAFDLFCHDKDSYAQAKALVTDAAIGWLEGSMSVEGYQFNSEGFDSYDVIDENTIVYDENSVDPNQQNQDGESSDPEAAAERPPHKFQAGQNGENLGNATVSQLVKIYSIKKLKKMSNSELKTVLKNAGVNLGDASIKKLKKALKQLAKLSTNQQTTSKIKRVLKEYKLSKAAINKLTPLLRKGIAVYETASVDVFSTVTSADMQKMTTDELRDYLWEKIGIYPDFDTCEKLKQVLKQLESTPNPTQTQIERALSDAAIYSGASTSSTRVRAELAAFLKAALEATLPKEISLAALAFENLKGAAEALDGWDSLGGDNQAEALKGVREKLETLQKDCDALSFQNLTEEEKAALKEKMEAALAALNDFLEGKEGSFSAEELKETLESLMGDVDDYWYSLEKQDPLETLAKLQALPTAVLHDYLKDTFGVGLNDSGVKKVRSALAALASIENPTPEQILAALKNSGLKVRDNTFEKLTEGIQQLLAAL